ncbi:MAG: hypothetical protein M3Q06_00770, partial [Bacteroidota bacterium]|nr:hypothetical protein [Bacteroidota bacterium]
GVDYYMPPERINTTSAKKYTKPPDFASDVYQIGLLMYVVLYHCLPFKGFIWEELAVAIKEGDAAFPERGANGFLVPQKLKRIVQTCLAKDPEKRYPNAAAIWNEFVAYAFKTKEFSIN